MKAAVLHAPGDLRYEEVETPQCGENDALVRVLACGICGSDIPRVTTTGTYSFPTIPGHEFMGQVAEVGTGVDRVKVGDRVGVVPLIPCRKCRYCATADHYHCEWYDYLGSRSDGGFAEYVKAPQENLVPLSEGVNDDTAALLEPMAVALHSVRRGQVESGDQVVVFGAGPIGILIAQWAAIAGAFRVIMVDIREPSLEVAQQVGIKHCIDASKQDVSEAVSELTDGQGADLVVEAAGSPHATSSALRVVRKKGRVLLVGRIENSYLMEADALDGLLRKELEVLGVWGFEFKDFPHNDWQMAVEALETGKVRVSPMITHRFPLSQVHDAFRLMTEGKEFYCKVLLIPGGEK